MEPQPGRIYIKLEERPDGSYKLFEKLLSEGYDCLLLTRTYPPKLEKDYKLKGAEIYWLSGQRKVGVKRLSSVAIPEINRTLFQFLDKSKKGAVLLDGYEYLITHNDFDFMLKVLKSYWKGHVEKSNSFMIISFDPLTVKEDELRAIKRDLEEYNG